MTEHHFTRPPFGQYPSPNYPVQQRPGVYFPPNAPSGPRPSTISVPPRVPKEWGIVKKKKILGDKILPRKVCELIPQAETYMDLLAFEKKLDHFISRRKFKIEETLKKPMKQKRKLRVSISNIFHPGTESGVEGGQDEGNLASWELLLDGRLLEEANTSIVKRKFSSYFDTLIIELDEHLYGPDNHLVKWTRTSNTQETDGFQIKRYGNKNVKCKIVFLLNYQPPQFKVDSRLVGLLGVQMQTMSAIINALWQYIKTHDLQDSYQKEYINCDEYMKQIFACPRMKFSEIPLRLRPFLHPPEPIIINHLISPDAGEQKQTVYVDIDVELDDPLKAQLSNCLLPTGNQQEIQYMDNRILNAIELINHTKIQLDFYASYSREPQQFIRKWIASQNTDLKAITDIVGNPEEERHAEFYYQTWLREAVCRYFYTKTQQRKTFLEQSLL